MPVTAYWSACAIGITNDVILVVWGYYCVYCDYQEERHREAGAGFCMGKRNSYVPVDCMLVVGLEPSFL